MSALQSRLDELRARGRRAVIPYLMSGFPSRASFRSLLRGILEGGADAVEIGLPFSDPLADGPVIQAAGQRALENGVTWASTREDVVALRDVRPEIPRILMSYLNPLRARGLDRAARESREAGFAAWILPDRDLDRPAEALRPCREHGLDCIPLVAPTTPLERLPRVLRGAGGFVYLVSVTGVTGARRGEKFELGSYVARVREHTELPLCIGFGVSDGAQAKRLARWADGVIVGSALLAPFLEQPVAKARTVCLRRFAGIRSALPR